MKQQLMVNNGSIQNIQNIPQELKDMYKTAYELSQKVLIDMSADRGAFICQSQSLNLFVENPNFGKLSSMHFYGWQKGLKTGMYYLRSKAAVDPIKFTVSEELRKSHKAGEKLKEGVIMQGKGNEEVATATKTQPGMCIIDDPDCLSCGA